MMSAAPVRLHPTSTLPESAHGAKLLVDQSPVVARHTQTRCFSTGRESILVRRCVEIVLTGFTSGGRGHVGMFFCEDEER